MLRRLFVLSLIISIIGFSCKSEFDHSENEMKMNEFIDSLMNKMTLNEKIGQLNLPSIGFDITGPIVNSNVDKQIKDGMVGGVFNSFTPDVLRKLQDIAVKETRLKIPLIFGYDVIHGHKTVYPIPLAMSCTWDTALIEQCSRMAAVEASADGLNWTFSPMVDIARDPRWGRISEGSGEDPFLGSMIAQSVVKGYQGNDIAANNTILACVKHFALYGAAEAGRDYNTVDMSDLRMYNEYLPPYQAAVEAGAATVMTSFNEINGVPATGNKWLLTHLLREKWEFNGFIVTDYTAVNEMIEHYYASDLKDAARLAVNAGVDMDMVGEGFILHLNDLVKEGKVKEETINDACRRILEAKYKLGLFEDPYRYMDNQRAKDNILTFENRELARKAAQNSIVLLKNDNNILPLSKDKTIAFIGPLADNQRELPGSWSAAGDWKNCISVYDAVDEQIGTEAKLMYAKGCNIVRDLDFLKKIGSQDEIDMRSEQVLMNEAVRTASGADIIVAVMGEAAGMSGEAASRSNLKLPENQIELLNALYKTGKPVVLVIMAGRPLIIESEIKNAQAVVYAWQGGIEAGNAVIDVLYGYFNPAGKLTVTFPRNEGQIPLYYNHKHTGRPFDPLTDEKYKSRYLDVANEPLFPFGFGLSYTTFAYKNLSVNKKEITKNESLKISVEVTNTGNYDGFEIVQLYIRDAVSSITRPVKELKGFKKIYLKKGETQIVSFEISDKNLGYFNDKYKYIIEPGEFEIFAGGNSNDVLQTKITLAE